MAKRRTIVQHIEESNRAKRRATTQGEEEKNNVA